MVGSQDGMRHDFCLMHHSKYVETYNISVAQMKD